jgi:ribosome-associated protein
MDEPKIKNFKTTLILPDMISEAVNAALEKKGQDLVVLNLSTSGAFTDYFVVCSGQTGRQVRAIVDGILKMLRENGTRPSHVEGYDNGEWVLIDCFDFIVHVFTKETRLFYDLDRLWGNAARMEFSNSN